MLIRGSPKHSMRERQYSQVPESDLRETDLDQLESVVDALVACALQHHASIPEQPASFDLKQDGSRVTELDRAIETDWRRIIQERCPEHSIVGEEYGRTDTPSRFCWYLDPVDGTDDFSRGMPLYGYIIALTYDGKPIMASTGHPVLGIDSRATRGRGTWVNGQRSRASAADAPSDLAIAIPSMDDFQRESDESAVLADLEKRFPNYRVYRNLYGHTAVVRGSLDAAVEFDVAPWDILATRLLVEESGGCFLQFRAVIGSDGVEKSGAVFGKELVVLDICAVLSGHGYQGRLADDLDAMRV